MLELVLAPGDGLEEAPVVAPVPRCKLLSASRRWRPGDAEEGFEAFLPRARGEQAKRRERVSSRRGAVGGQRRGGAVAELHRSGITFEAKAHGREYYLRIGADAKLLEKLVRVPTILEVPAPSRV